MKSKFKGFLPIICFALTAIVGAITIDSFVTHEIAPGARSTFAKGATGGTSGSYNGRLYFADAPPTISECGATVAGTATAWSSSNAGTVTVGSTTGTNGVAVPVLLCTVTYATAATFIPAVGVWSHFIGAQVQGVTRSTTAFTVTFNADMTGHTFSYTSF